MLKKFREDLHKIPELGFNEFKTQEYIINNIKDLNCTYEKVNTGIVLFFDYGCDYSICFRADMDGLPILEETSLEFKSNNGNMHACGHDGHMAMCLALAYYLSENVKNLNKNVVILFQPSEEIYGGALSILKSGVLEKYNVKAMFGTHIWPNLEDGIIYTREKEMMAKSNEVDIIIRGKSAHAASSDEGCDALRSGVLFCNMMYEYIDSLDKNIYKLLKFGKFESGSIRNIISDNTHIYATLRAYSDEVLDDIKTRMNTVKCLIEEKFGTKIEIIIKDGGYPPVINDSNLVSKLLKINKDVVLMEKPVMQAEDFGNYCSAIPSLFMFLGNSKKVPLHNSKYDFNEDILESGLNNYIKLLDIEL